MLFSALLHDDDICDPKAFPHSPFCMQLVDIIASLPGEAGQCLLCCTVFSAVCEGGISVLCAALQLRIEFRTLSYIFVVGSSLRDWLLWHLPLLSRVPVMFAGSYLPCQATRGSCFDVGRVDRKILNQQFLWLFYMYSCSLNFSISAVHLKVGSRQKEQRRLWHWKEKCRTKFQSAR